MSKRTLPAAAVSARGGFQTVPTAVALERYQPDLRLAASDGVEDPQSISMFGAVGADPWTGDGITAKRIAGALRAIGPKNDVVVNVNSPGGDYFEGLAIYNLLREHQGAVVVNVLGIAASAASVIAMAGDTVRVARAGFLMIHNAWIVTMGDRNALRDAADWLEPFDAVARDIYAARSGLSDAALTKMLDRETWIGGVEAVDKGFADELLAADQVAADAPAGDAKQALAWQKLDVVLARAGVARGERRKLLSELRGTPGAALEGTPRAAFEQEAAALLASLTAR